MSFFIETYLKHNPQCSSLRESQGQEQDNTSYLQQPDVNGKIRTEWEITTIAYTPGIKNSYYKMQKKILEQQQLIFFNIIESVNYFYIKYINHVGY